VIQVTPKINSRRLRRDLKRDRGQIPFAMANAINDTMKQGQTAVRANLRRKFTLRRKQFIERSIKINRSDFANKRKLTARLHLEERADFLAKFEEGGEKRPEQGRFLAVPIDVKRSAAGIVPRRLRPQAIRGNPKIKHFRVSNVGLVQVLGRGKRRVTRLLYLFVRRVPIPRRPFFMQQMMTTIRTRFEPNLDKRFREAVATKR